MLRGDCGFRARVVDASGLRGMVMGKAEFVEMVTGWGRTEMLKLARRWGFTAHKLDDRRLALLLWRLRAKHP